MADKFDAERKERFLKLYAEWGLINKAARAVDISPETVRVHREEDEAFAADMSEALRDFRDTLEAEAYRRAVDGLQDPVFYKGDECGHKNVYSDRMLELLLKRHMPEYRDKQTVDMNLQAGVLVVPGAAMTVEEWAAANAVTVKQTVNEGVGKAGGDSGDNVDNGDSS